jgi:hypothetical protein
MDWLDKLANETRQHESASKAREADNEANFNRVFHRFDSAIAGRFEKYAATLRTSRQYPNAIARQGTFPVGSKYWSISNVGGTGIELTLGGGAYHEAAFYLRGILDAATESTYGDAQCLASEFSIEWLDAQMEPILRKALLQ